MRKWALLLPVLASGLAACATGPQRFPVQATRFHYDAVAGRGTVAVEPVPGAVDAGIEYQAYADAVRAELQRLGFIPIATGAQAQYLAVVSFNRALRPLPARSSGFSLGLGGGGFSGGRNGGVGLGGGVGIPIGGARSGDAVATELSVRIRRGPDAVWEGQARSLTDTRAPDAATPAIAQRLATALFSGFPGESGRTIEVR